ncbi:hypothetical protein GUJ93_ZPchr0006g42976 [Zizania palustris]|uniref:Phosphatidylinositol-glycan biosynthesis class F protein n=1 Tax=Zizania palustris TaxID=103762 RepID=A0A8J5TDY8_ZIZPA|nr:hypothetical protein GUJ93_ZPchr0006g42976 [Zizania palustris]
MDKIYLLTYGPFIGWHICRYWTATIYWSLLMSLFTFVPAACVFGASKVNWQNVLSHSKYITDSYIKIVLEVHSVDIFIICCVFPHISYCRPTNAVDYMISAPAHGAVIGAWLGAWPMPLDWERTWQEWPICVTYGSVAGYLIGMAISLLLIVTRKRRDRAKAD